MTPTKVTRPAYARWAGFFLSGCFLAGVTAVGGEPGPAANPQAGARVSPLDAERVASLSVSSPAAIPANVSLPVEGNAVYLPLQIEFRDAAARKQFRAPEGVAVFHEFDRFGDAFLDVRLKQSIDDLQAMEGVTWVDIDMDVIQAPPLPKVTPSGERPREVHQVVRGGFGGLTGKGVLVAVIDDGVDFRPQGLRHARRPGFAGFTARLLLGHLRRPARRRPAGDASPLHLPQRRPDRNGV